MICWLFGRWAVRWKRSGLKDEFEGWNTSKNERSFKGFIIEHGLKPPLTNFVGDPEVGGGAGVV
jgi:hypothetical protein